MAKYCPVTNSRKTYLDCMECEEKECEKERELAVKSVIYLKMKPGESKEAAVARLHKVLSDAGVEILDTDDCEVRFV